MSNILIELKAERDKVTKHLDYLNKTIQYYEELEGSITKKDTSYTSEGFIYRKGDTFKDTVLNYMKNEIERYSLATEIAKELIRYFPDKEGKFDDFKSNLSTILSNAKKENVISGYKIGAGKKDTVWGKKEWRDESGEIIEKYKFIDKDGQIRNEYK